MAFPASGAFHCEIGSKHRGRRFGSVALRYSRHRSSEAQTEDRRTVRRTQTGDDFAFALSLLALRFDAAQQMEIRFGRIRCQGHFSLAMALHLAIMCGQLGNEWDTRFHKTNGNYVSSFCTGPSFLVRCHRVMCPSEYPPPGAGARRVQLLRRSRAASNFHKQSDNVKTCKGLATPWQYA